MSPRRRRAPWWWVRYIDGVRVRVKAWSEREAAEWGLKRRAVTVIRVEDGLGNQAWPLAGRHYVEHWPWELRHLRPHGDTWPLEPDPAQVDS